MIHSGHGGDALAIGERHELDGVFGKSGSGSAGAEGGGDGAVGVDGFAAAAKDRGVAGFETEGGGVGSDVGSALVNDSDRPDGNSDLFDVQAVGLGPGFEDLADGIGQGGDVFESGCDGFKSCGIEFQTIDHGATQAFFLTRLEVFLVFREDVGFVLTESVRHRAEDGVFLIGGEGSELIRRCTGLFAHGVDLLGDGVGHELTFWR